MAFKIYFNKKTKHPSVSLSSEDKTRWENLEMTHHPSKKNKYIIVVCVSLSGCSQSYVRKYIRKDRKGVKGKLHKNTKLDYSSENRIVIYLKSHKKR